MSLKLSTERDGCSRGHGYIVSRRDLLAALLELLYFPFFPYSSEM